MRFAEINNVSKLTKFTTVNEDFTRCRCNIFYTGKNRNYTDITEEALQSFIERKGYANVPVVAHLYKDKDGNYVVGGHDYKIEISGTNVEFVDETVPFGVIPEDCNPAIEEYKEKSGATKKYFCVDILLWTHRYPIMKAAYNDEIYFNQSMEITIDSYSAEGDYLVINNFSLSALCLLNKSNDDSNVEPCFESSAVRKFSAELEKTDFKQNFDELLKRYSQSKTQKGDEKSMKNKLNKALELVTFCNIFGEQTARYALASFTEDTAGLFDRTDGKIYKVKFSEENEEITFDFESKVEAAFSVEDKSDTSFDHVIEISRLCSYSAEQQRKDTEHGIEERLKKLDEERKAESAKYAELQKQYAAVSEQLVRYQQAEQKRKDEEHKESIDKLIKEYENALRLCPEYIAYVSDTKKYQKDAAEIKNELDRMLGSYAKAKEDSGEEYNPVVFAAQGLNFNYSGKKSREEARYADLLEKQRMKYQN